MSMTVMVMFNGNDVSLTFGRDFFIIRPDSKLSLGTKYSSKNEVFLHQKLTEKYWVIYNDLLRLITHFPSFQVQSSPTKSPFSPSAFSPKSSILILSKFWTVLKINFRNGGKFTFRWGNLTWGNFIQKLGKMADHPF